MHPPRRRFLQASALGAVALPTLLMGCTKVAEASAGVAGSDVSGAWPASIMALEPMQPHVVPITDGEREERLAKAQRLMRENQLDAIYVDGGISLAYFTGMHWFTSERMMGMVLPQSGDPIYITPAFEQSRALEQIRFGRDVRAWNEDESPYERIAQILADLHIATGALGIEEQVPYFRSAGIAAAAPQIKLVSASPVTVGCRSIKSPAELALMQVANTATLAVYQAVYQALEPGMTQQQVSALVSAAFARIGSPGFVSINVGKYSAQPHGSIEPQRLDEGTVIMLDGDCKADGYSSDITRTFTMGKASDKMKKVFDIVKTAQQAALQAARPGSTMASVDAAARKVIGDSGYGFGYQHFGHRLGHGIGMGGHEWHYLVRGNERKLEPNMTFSNEPGVYLPGEFGVRLEDCMYIAGDGARLFTPVSPSIEQPFG